MGLVITTKPKSSIKLIDKISQTVTIIRPYMQQGKIKLDIQTSKTVIIEHETKQELKTV